MREVIYLETNSLLSCVANSACIVLHKSERHIVVVAFAVLVAVLWFFLMQLLLLRLAPEVRGDKVTI